MLSIRKRVGPELVKVAPALMQTDVIERKFSSANWKACLVLNQFFRDMEAEGQIIRETDAYTLRRWQWVLSLGTGDFADMEEEKRELQRRVNLKMDEVDLPVREAQRSRVIFGRDQILYAAKRKPYKDAELRLLQEETELFSPWVKEHSSTLPKTAFAMVKKLLSQLRPEFTLDKELSCGSTKVFSAMPNPNWKQCICVDTISLKNPSFPLLDLKGQPLDYIRVLDMWTVLVESDAGQKAMDDYESHINLSHLFNRLVYTELHRQFRQFAELERNVRFKLFYFDVIFDLITPRLNEAFK